MDVAAGLAVPGGSIICYRRVDRLIMYGSHDLIDKHLRSKKGRKERRGERDRRERGDDELSVKLPPVYPVTDVRGWGSVQ